MSRLYTLILVFAMTLPMMAGVRSEEEGAALASEVLRTSTTAGAPRRVAGKSEMRLAFRQMKNQGDEPALYAYNNPTGGWAVISADDRTRDVLCYSDEGQIDETTMNPSLRWWLSRFVKEISSVTDETAYAAPARVATVTAIGPLLGNIAYDQEAPYYNQCPIDESDNKRTLTGCVATAAAMIMRYYQYPSQGVGTYSYTWENCVVRTSSGGCKQYTKKELSADFGATTYDWSLIRETYTNRNPGSEAERNEIAKLMYHCGVACDMEYSSDGSGSYTDWMIDGMEMHFNYTYSKFLTQYSKKQYTARTSAAKTVYSATTADITQYINADLEAKHPVLMGGVDPKDGGHEFVCDGRNTQGELHINWGWNGDGNCYTAITSMKPGGFSSGFNTDLDISVGLQPNDISETSVTVSPNTLTLDIHASAVLTATVLPVESAYKEVKWTSANPSIATVDETGRVTGVSQGSTLIRATTTHLGKRSSCTVTVTDKEAPTAVEQVTSDKGQVTKVMHNGQVVIERGDNQYTILGLKIR